VAVPFSLSPFSRLEVFYNRQRIHQTLGYVTPEQFETRQKWVSLLFYLSFRKWVSFFSFFSWLPDPFFPTVLFN
jgi:hypothetical protein